MVGRIIGPKSGGWWPVELDYTPLKKDLLSAQLVYNAKEIGMKPDIDFIVILISEVTNLKLTRKAYALRGVSQKKIFEANAIFDTGANVFGLGVKTFCMTSKS